MASICHEVDKFYKDRETPIDKTIQIYQYRRGVHPRAMELALEQIYPEREDIQPMELIHRAYLKAMRIDKKIIEWKGRNIIKKFIYSITFPQTIWWEYNRWHTSLK
jgi:hypothetical protein